jgi:hypothetical protein
MEANAAMSALVAAAGTGCGSGGGRAAGDQFGEGAGTEAHPILLVVFMHLINSSTPTANCVPNHAHWLLHRPLSPSPSAVPPASGRYRIKG